MKKVTLFIISLLALSIAGCATPLHTASGGGDAKKVVELLDKGKYDINERAYDCTPLHYAAMYGQINTVRLLLDRGEDIHAKCKGWTSLTYAAFQGHTDVAKLLIDKGIDIDDAMASLDRYGGSNSKAGIKLLERLAKKPDPGGQSMAVKSTTSSTSPLPIKSDVDELPFMNAKPNKHAYAIVVGIEEYRQKLPKVDFAVSDARLVSEYLTKVMGYPEENVVLLTNDKALQSDLTKYFEKWLHNNVEKGGTVFVYYSGHGAPDPKTGGAYLVPYDGDPSFISETGYSLKRMYDTLGKLQAKEIIVALDSCFSGAGGRSVLAKGARPLVLNLQDTIVSSLNMTVMAAASGDQMSSTYDEKGHGLFTYFMLKGIKNEGVVKSDGSIAISDLFGYLKPQVERISRKQYNNEQTPQLIGAIKN